MMCTVSVVIPAFNAERYLAEAVRSALNQSSPPFEIIVVDDGSTDATGALAQAFGPPVRLVTIPHGGIGAARNAGLAAATGNYIALLDADDTWEPGKLEAQLSVLGADGGAAGVFCHVVQFVSPELSIAERRQLAVAEAPMAGVIPSALLARREVFDRVGPFDTALRVGEFIDWHARATAAGLRFAMLDVVLVGRRLHTTNTGRRERDSRADYLRVIKSALDRRREGAAGA